MPCTRRGSGTTSPTATTRPRRGRTSPAPRRRGDPAPGGARGPASTILKGTMSAATAEAFLDLGANLAPVPPPAGVVDALRAAAGRPDPGYRRLRAALAGRLGVAPEDVVPGNGSIELIYLACRVLCPAGGTVAVLTPTFEEYEQAASFVGARIVRFG